MEIKVVNNLLDGIPEIAIRGDITEATAGEVADAISKVSGGKVRLLFNSAGGEVLAAFTVLSAMSRFMNGGGIIETFNEGRADSAAGWLAAAGSVGYRNAYNFSGVFLHPPMLADGRTIKDFAKDDPVRVNLEEHFDKLVNIFSNVTGINSATVRDIMSKERDLSAQEAANLGLIDNVLQVENTPVFRNGATRLEVVNTTSNLTFKVLNKSDEMEFKILNKTLGLVAEASEDARVGAVTVLIAERDESLVTNKALAAENATLKATIKAVEDEREAEVVNAAKTYVTAYLETHPAQKESEAILINWAKSDIDAFKKLHPVELAPIVNQSIDGGITEEEDKAKEKAEAEEADKFDKLSVAERETVKNSNIKEYRRLSALRAKHKFGL